MECVMTVALTRPDHNNARLAGYATCAADACIAIATAKSKPERINVFRRPIPPAKIRVTGGNAKTVPTKYRVHVNKVNSLAPGSRFNSPVMTLLKEIKFVVCDQYPISDPNNTAPNTAAPVALIVFGN